MNKRSPGGYSPQGHEELDTTEPPTPYIPLSVPPGSSTTEPRGISSQMPSRPLALPSSPHPMEEEMATHATVLA